MAVLLTAALMVQAGIYPDKHWSFSTELTKDNHKEVIKDTISTGKTLFVRFIASEG